MKSQLHLGSKVLALSILCLLYAGVAQAQLISYPGKMVCGYERGNVPFLSDPNPVSPYEELKPGNYATSFNMLNLNLTPQDVNVFASIEGIGIFFVTTVANVPSFGTATVGCNDVAAAAGQGPGGPRFEGFLIPVVNNANWVTDAVYTFESQNGFERHIYYTEDIFGGVFVKQQALNKTLPQVCGPISGEVEGFPLAASGAGGLGLGASIDIERLPPIAVLDGAVGALPPADIKPEG